MSGSVSVDEPHNVDNAFATGRKLNESTKARGGPIPIGPYTIAKPEEHPHLGLAAKLTPYSPKAHRSSLDRGGFYIHGRGRKGSDGCIVSTFVLDDSYTLKQDKTDYSVRFHQFMDALSCDHGGKLTVLETMDGDRFA